MENVFYYINDCYFVAEEMIFIRKFEINLWGAVTLDSFLVNSSMNRTGLWVAVTLDSFLANNSMNRTVFFCC